MSSMAQKPVNEPAQTGPVFSYAQAAKGKSPSISPTSLPRKAVSEATETRSAQPKPQDNSEKASNTDGSEPIRRPSEGRAAKATDWRSGINPDSLSDGKVTTNTTTATPSPQRRSEAHSPNAGSAPSSPDFGSTTASLLPKEDDLFSIPNGSSDSTWDKHSQTSRGGDKNGEKAESAKETDMEGNEAKEADSKSSWDEEPPSPTVLKEAPPPTINFWQQRMEAQEAKARATKQTAIHQSMKVAGLTNGSGQPSSVSKGPDIAGDLKKGDARKKSKSSPAANDEKPIPISGKATDAKFTRIPDLEKVHRVMEQPPPPGDAMSWPTPENALSEEKRKGQERGDKGDVRASTTKSHGKEKWMPVVYVPTAKFNTPLPPNRRGGRGGGRGGREGGGRGGLAHNSSFVGEKPFGSFQGNMNTSPRLDSGHDRADSTLARGVFSSTRPKRSSSAGPATAREQRKQTDTGSPGKRKELGHEDSKMNRDNLIASEQHPQTDLPQGDLAANAAQPTSRAAPSVENTSQSAQVEVNELNGGVSHDNHAHPRSGGPDRRSEGSIRNLEYGRDFHSHLPLRERGEGRLERGRGGYRTRGGNNGFSGSHQANGQGYPSGHQPYQQSSTNYIHPKSYSQGERHTLQNGSSPYPPLHQQPRNYRANSRSQTAPNSAPYSRFSGGSQSSSQHPSSIQTDVANVYGYQSGHSGIMSAVPYTGYVEQVQLLNMVSMQMEYYFSVDNLCKDLFLRRHMDSKGYVFLNILAQFNRIKQLTQDLDHVRYVCVRSPNIEIYIGADGIDRLRKQDGWQQWVLSMEERDPSAQNDGPAGTSESHVQQKQAFTVPQGFSDRQVSPKTNQSSSWMDVGRYQSFDGMPPPSFIPNAPLTTINGNTNHTPLTQTPLSAAVPDFAPGVSTLTNFGLSRLATHAQVESSFSDEQVESLMIVVRKQPHSSAPLRPPFPSASSRTFSNGSIDGPGIFDELHRLEENHKGPNVNGDGSPENFDALLRQRSRSPFHIGLPIKHGQHTASPVFWVKDKETPIGSLPNDLTHEFYTTFRRNALCNRDHSLPGVCHPDMDILYQFWSHFLVRNFNANMYQEFRQTAFEDASHHQSTIGLNNLIQYYDASILSEKVISDEIAQDFVDLVRTEALGRSSKNRPAFDRLRAAWRNGAFNMKNRKKIDNVLDADLKGELER